MLRNNKDGTGSAAETMKLKVTRDEHESFMGHTEGFSFTEARQWPPERG